jgi:hypothetical protein
MCVRYRMCVRGMICVSEDMLDVACISLCRTACVRSIIHSDKYLSHSDGGRCSCEVPVIVSLLTNIWNVHAVVNKPS